MLSVHLSGGGDMLKAAVNGAGDKLRLLGISVLTSSSEATLREIGVEAPSVEAQVSRLARLGWESGFRGVVASPLETAVLRREFGPEMRIVTPGVRPTAGEKKSDDQHRVLTPAEAVKVGADFLVIGRPITAHPDPREAARRIVEEISGALA